MGCCSCTLHALFRQLRDAMCIFLWLCARSCHDFREEGAQIIDVMRSHELPRANCWYGRCGGGGGGGVIPKNAQRGVKRKSRKQVNPPHYHFARPGKGLLSWFKSTTKGGLPRQHTCNQQRNLTSSARRHQGQQSGACPTIIAGADSDT